MEKVRINLLKEMESIEVDKKTEVTLNNLAYAASETGIIDFELHGDFVEIIRLVKLAERYKEGIPETLIL